MRCHLFMILDHKSTSELLPTLTCLSDHSLQEAALLAPQHEDTANSPTEKPTGQGMEASWQQPCEYIVLEVECPTFQAFRTKSYLTV